MSQSRKVQVVLRLGSSAAGLGLGFHPAMELWDTGEEIKAAANTLGSVHVAHLAQLISKLKG